MEKTTNNSYPSLLQSIALVGIFIFCFIVFRVSLDFLNDLLGNEFAFLIHYLLTAGVTLACAFFLAKERVPDFSFNISKPSISISFLVVVIALVLFLGLVAPMMDFIPISKETEKSFEELANQRDPITFLQMVIVAPIVEELLFRGVILAGLLKRYSPDKAILMSSLLFGIAHLNPWQFIIGLIIGGFSGWIYYKSRNLSLSIIIHMATNLCGFLIPFFMPNNTTVVEDWSYGSLLNNVLAMVLALLISLIGLIIMNKRFNRSWA